jgi:hypothetical protein
MPLLPMALPLTDDVIIPGSQVLQTQSYGELVGWHLLQRASTCARKVIVDVT